MLDLAHVGFMAGKGNYAVYSTANLSIADSRSLNFHFSYVLLKTNDVDLLLCYNEPPHTESTPLNLILLVTNFANKKMMQKVEK